MSLFRLLKYSSLLYFLRRYRGRIFRIVAVLLFALVTNLLYQDVADYLELRHPGALVWALVGKIIIVYGALAFVLWQFRPAKDAAPEAGAGSAPAAAKDSRVTRQAAPQPTDRLSALADIEHHDRLRTRYDRVLEARGGNGEKPKDPG